jgi:hypothetical protein
MKNSKLYKNCNVDYDESFPEINDDSKESEGGDDEYNGDEQDSEKFTWYDYAPMIGYLTEYNICDDNYVEEHKDKENCNKEYNWIEELYSYLFLG